MSSTGRVAGVNPQHWKIIEGKLYLGWSQQSVDQFAEKAEENILKADRNWEKAKR